MSYAVGVNSGGRDIGYGVPAFCDHPECSEKIDRGMAYACGGECDGGEHGCGLYFCDNHRGGRHSTCLCCSDGRAPFHPKPDHPQWVKHKLTDKSWAKWRAENPEWVAKALKMDFHALGVLPAEHTEPPAKEVNLDDLLRAMKLVKQIGPMRIVATVGATDGYSALKNKCTTEHVACDIPDEKPYADLMVLLLNNAEALIVTALEKEHGRL